MSPGERGRYGLGALWKLYLMKQVQVAGGAGLDEAGLQAGRSQERWRRAGKGSLGTDSKPLIHSLPSDECKPHLPFGKKDPL